MFCGSGSVCRFQAAQGILHRHGAPHQAGRTGIGWNRADRENQATTMLARMPKTTSQIRLVTMWPDARAAAFPVIAAQEAVDHVADDARQE